MKPGPRPRGCPTGCNARGSRALCLALLLATVLFSFTFLKEPATAPPKSSLAKHLPTAIHKEPQTRATQPELITAAEASAGDFVGFSHERGGEKESARPLADWIGTDPKAAAEWAWQLSAPDLRRRHLGQVLAAWCARDPSAAAAWTQAREPGALRDLAFSIVAQEWADKNPTNAAALALACTDETIRTVALAHVARVWAAQAPAAACDWMASLPPGLAGDRVRCALALAVATHDPRAAARLALDSLPPGPELDRAVVGIVQRWAERSPPEAAAWLEQFPAQPLRGVAVECFVRVWSRNDWEALGSWIKHLPAGGLRDEAAAALACVARPRDAQAARAWASLIINPEARKACFAALEP